MNGARHRRCAIGRDGDHGRARRAEAGAGGITEAEVEGFVRFKQAVGEHGQGDAAIAGLAVGPVQSAADTGVVAGRHRAAVAGGELHTGRTVAAAAAQRIDREHGLAGAIFGNAEAGRLQLNRARHCDVVADNRHCRGVGSRQAQAAAGIGKTDVDGFVRLDQGIVQNRHHNLFRCRLAVGPIQAAVSAGVIAAGAGAATAAGVVQRYRAISAAVSIDG